jgi:outer membrane protein W
MLQRRSILTGWVVTLSIAAVCAADNGPGLGIKVGGQTLTSPLTDEKTTRPRIEVELCSSRLLNDQMDVAFSFGFSSLGSLSTSETSVEDGLIIDAWSKDDLRLYDFRLAARYYPLGSGRRALMPYLGAGLGYFQFIDDWEDTVTVTDPLTDDSVTDVTDGKKTLAKGIFPFFLAGLNVPLGDSAELLLEIEYDVDKQDGGFDLSGPIYMIGCRFRW